MDRQSFERAEWAATNRIRLILEQPVKLRSARAYTSTVFYVQRFRHALLTFLEVRETL